MERILIHNENKNGSQKYDKSIILKNRTLGKNKNNDDEAIIKIYSKNTLLKYAREQINTLPGDTYTYLNLIKNITTILF